MQSKFSPIIRIIEEDYEIPQLKRRRRISALLPYDYETSGKTYPVLYLNDGQNLFDENAPYGNWGIDKSLTKLAKQGFGDVIIIAIDHGKENRLSEYLPYDSPRFGEGAGDLYIQFLVETLKPYVDKKFRVFTDNRNTGIGGSSMGGLISLYAGLMRPDIFSNMMIFSPSLWIVDGVYKEIPNFSPTSATDFYIYSGGQESQEHRGNVERLEALIKGKENDHIRYSFNFNPQGKHQEKYWATEFPKALKWLFFDTEHLHMNIKQLSKPSKKYKNILYPFFLEESDTAFISSVTGLQHIPPFKAKVNEVATIIRPETGQQIFLLGLGKQKTSALADKRFRAFALQQKDNISKNLAVDIQHLPKKAAYYAALGLVQATYDIGFYKTDKKEVHPFLTQSFELGIVSSKKIAGLIHEGATTADCQNRIIELVDLPANVKTPAYLAQHVQASGNTYGYKVEVLDKEALEKENLHALLAVGQGSVNPPVLIKMEYKPEKSKSTQAILGLAGKGITFDTGGVSLKGSANLHYMKSDMGGAAAVIGAVELAARLKLDIHIVALVPAAENSIDAMSVLPGDVIQSYSGKSIEIIDTDAEGRLILADALAYLHKNYQPKIMLDLATLTGSCVRALGYAACGLFTNNDELSDMIIEAGQQTQEKAWRLPLWDDYSADIQSDIADVKNLSGKPINGAISAAKFLEVFTDEHPHWAHLDIAGVSFGSTPFSKTKSATGFGVRLLVQLMKKLAN